MARFSMLMMTTFLVGLLMFATGLVCLYKGLNMHQKGDPENGSLIMTVGVVLIIFGPVIMALSAIYYVMSTKQLRDAAQWC